MPTEVPVKTPRPYRWGKFQGYAVIVAGAVTLATMVSVLFAPDNEFARGFFEASDPTLLVTLREDLATGNHAGIAGILTGWSVLTFPVGIGILKKRMFTFLFVMLWLLRSAATANVGGIVVWTLSGYYYYKRRSEFRWP